MQGYQAGQACSETTPRTKHPLLPRRDLDQPVLRLQTPFPTTYSLKMINNVKPRLTARKTSNRDFPHLTRGLLLITAQVTPWLSVESHGSRFSLQ